MASRPDGDVMDTMNWWKDKLDRALLIKPRPRKEPSIYATFYERMMASAIDMGVLYFLLAPTMFAIKQQIFGQMSDEQKALMLSIFVNPAVIMKSYNEVIDSGLIAFLIVDSILQIVVIAVSYISCQMLFKNTPGKWLLGLKLTTSDNQTFPALWRLMLRYMGYGISCAPLLLGVVWMNFDKQSRTWHDWLAGTRVITTRPDGWYWAQTKRGFFWAKERLLRK